MKQRGKINVDADLLARVKIRAAKERTSMTALVEGWIREGLKRK